MRLSALIAGVWGFISFAAIAAASIGTGPDPNLAINDPDQQAWQLFIEVNAAAPGANNALFETWSRDADLFQLNPAWPTSARPILGAPRALSLPALIAHRGFQVQVVPPSGTELVAEETRRNKPAFDFIVQNNLYKVSGLRAAFAAGKTLSFPVDAIEVKANWVDVTRLKEFNGFAGTPAQAAELYHVNSVGGKSYALVSFHIISKLVPNWTWATFEHTDNPGRCDIIGCTDHFGAQVTFEAPKSPVESKSHYPPCTKTAALTALLSSAHIDPAFANYCLKGTQSDFTDPTGLAVRLGNSVTEQSFVAQASCMSCHGRASFDSTGHPTSFAGFAINSPNLKLGDPNYIGNAPVGPISPSWYWVASGPPYDPVLAGNSQLTRIAMPADFVWSIPFCAIDDTANPPQTKSRFCAGK